MSNQYEGDPLFGDEDAVEASADEFFAALEADADPLPDSPAEIAEAVIEGNDEYESKTDPEDLIPNRVTLKNQDGADITEEEYIENADDPAEAAEAVAQGVLAQESLTAPVIEPEPTPEQRDADALNKFSPDDFVPPKNELTFVEMREMCARIWKKDRNGISRHGLKCFIKIKERIEQLAAEEEMLL